MFEGPIFQILGGLGVLIGTVLVTMFGARNKDKLPPYFRRANEELTEPAESFEDLVNRKVSKATEELTNTVVRLEGQLQAQATTFGKQEAELDERIEKLETSLNQKDSLLAEKDKALEESRSVNSIMADSAKNMTERMTKIENQMEVLQKKYEEKVEALTEREKLISELETQLKIQQKSIELLKDVSSRPIIVQLVTGEHEITHKSVEKPEENGD